MWDWTYTFEILAESYARAVVVTIEATLLGFVLAATLGLILAIVRLAVPRTAWLDFRRPWSSSGRHHCLSRFSLSISCFQISGLCLMPLPPACLPSVCIMLPIVPKCTVPASTMCIVDNGRRLSPLISTRGRRFEISSYRRQFLRWFPLSAITWSRLFKETPLLSAIAVLELMQTAKIIGSETFRYIEPITLVGLFFLSMSLISAMAVRFIEGFINRRLVR